ncbi:oligomeric golgi complex component, COG2-domain-containing protein [Xylogone sp. PMI_703]|nr:oligomeric golgi complex component, COG2-domain-containing protein [Xylogone sp. PMI_703]
MSKFYFGEESESVSSADDDDDNLPYPEALPRSDFLKPDFDALAYLSTLSDRHQTLEDLRSDLRERSQFLSKELLDLVNTNYEQFLSLGSDLKGGEEKVEDVRVGLLGFKRGIEDVKSKVKERKVEVEGLLKQKKDVSRQISLGRNLLEIDARLEELEDKLIVDSLPNGANRLEHDAWSNSEDEDDDDDEVADVSLGGGISSKKLQRLASDYRQVEQQAAAIGSDHPFIAAQQPRMMKVRNTILLDLTTALKQTKTMGKKGDGQLVKLMGIYRDLDAGAEAIKILDDFKSR